MAKAHDQGAPFYRVDAIPMPWKAKTFLDVDPANPDLEGEQVTTAMRILLGDRVDGVEDRFELYRAFGDPRRSDPI